MPRLLRKFASFFIILILFGVGVYKVITWKISPALAVPGTLILPSSSTAATFTTATITNLTLGGTAITATAEEINSIRLKAPLASPSFTGDVFFPGLGVWKSTGKVGIGTTSPQKQLEIVAATSTINNTSGNLSIIPAANLIIPQGNVGIGTTGPVHKLVVSGGDGMFEVLNAGEAAFALSNTADSSLWYVAAKSTGFLFRQSGVRDVLFLEKTTGNVGIGTTSPAAKLDLVGGSMLIDNAQYYRGRDSGGTSRSLLGINASDVVTVGTSGMATSDTQILAGGVTAVTIKNTSGNVGIGTTSPGSKLQISGGKLSHPEKFLYSWTTTGTKYAKIYTNTGASTTAYLNFNLRSLSYSETTVNVEIWIPTYNNWDSGTNTKPTVIVTGHRLDGYELTFQEIQIVKPSNLTTEVWLKMSDTNQGNRLTYITQMPGSEEIFTSGIVQDSAPTALVNSYPIPHTGSKTYSHGLNINGNVGIGTASPGYKLTVNGQPGANGYTAFTNYSDARLKENVLYLGDGYLDKIMQLKPSTFRYNALSGYDKATRARTISGFIAQDLQPLFPEMIGKITINKKEYLDTNLSSLQIYLVRAIQELYKKVTDWIVRLEYKVDNNHEELNTKIDAQQKEIEELKKQIIEMKK